MFDELGSGDVRDQGAHHHPDMRDLTVDEAVTAMVLNGALLQKPPVIWYKDQFTADPRSLETGHARFLPL